jgi:hypothetical protein
MSKAPARKPTDIVQLKLRLREELRRKLERAAAKKEHSLNTEMVERLDRSFDLEVQASDREEILRELQYIRAMITGHPAPESLKREGEK